MFHRVDDMLALPAPKFARLACRMFAYQGVVRAKLEFLITQEDKGKGRQDKRTTVDLTPDMVSGDPMLAGLVEHKRS